MILPMIPRPVVRTMIVGVVALRAVIIAVILPMIPRPVVRTMIVGVVAPRVVIIAMVPRMAVAAVVPRPAVCRPFRVSLQGCVRLICGGQNLLLAPAPRPDRNCDRENYANACHVMSIHDHLLSCPR